MSAMDLTRCALIRALEPAMAARPSVDAAVRARAEGLAARIVAGGIDAHVIRRGHADHAVEAVGAGLFAREFGSHDAAPEPSIAPLVEDPS